MTAPNVGQNIKAIIREKNLVQRWVAEDAGFTPQQLTAMVKGRKVIKAEYLPRLAKALGVSVLDLLEPPFEGGAG